MKRWGRSSVVAVALSIIVVGAAATPAFAAAPTILNVSPPTGENTASGLVITFTGTGMDTATAAALRKAGHSDINGTSFVSDDATHSHATFNLTGAAIGCSQNSGRSHEAVAAEETPFATSHRHSRRRGRELQSERPY